MKLKNLHEDASAWAAARSYVDLLLPYLEEEGLLFYQTAAFAGYAGKETPGMNIMIYPPNHTSMTAKRVVRVSIFNDGHTIVLLFTDTRSSVGFKTDMHDPISFPKIVDFAKEHLGYEA